MELPWIQNRGSPVCAILAFAESQSPGMSHNTLYMIIAIVSSLCAIIIAVIIAICCRIKYKSAAARKGYVIKKFWKSIWNHFWDRAVIFRHNGYTAGSKKGKHGLNKPDLQPPDLWLHHQDNLELKHVGEKSPHEIVPILKHSNEYTNNINLSATLDRLQKRTNSFVGTSSMLRVHFADFSDCSQKLRVASWMVVFWNIFGMS